jgi:hypothetical protein
MVDGGVGIECSPEPVDAQHYHEKNGQDQSRFGDLRAHGSGYDFS